MRLQMTFVLDKLCVGGIDDASKPWKLKGYGISHILTIDVKPLPIECRQGFEYKYIHALDIEEFDLLERIPDCLKFIAKGREEGGVLVHCHAGQSRSATLVLAYIMQKMSLSLSDAMMLLQKLRPSVRPNAGFLSQLELFESMGNKIDPQNQQFKLYKLSRLASQIQMGHSKDALPIHNMAADPSQGISANEKYYKCRKCRRGLFKHSAILSHTEGSGEAAFDWRVQQCTGSQEDAPVCSRSLFIEPVQWMSEDILEIEGKLSCPKCSAKIGSFRWTGEKCPCGTWVTPAFHIQTNKVDQTVHRNISQLSYPTRSAGPCPVVKPSHKFHVALVDEENISESAGSEEKNDRIEATEEATQKERETIITQNAQKVDDNNKQGNNLKESSLPVVAELRDAVGIQDSGGELPPL